MAATTRPKAASTTGKAEAKPRTTAKPGITPATQRAPATTSTPGPPAPTSRPQTPDEYTPSRTSEQNEYRDMLAGLIR